jgi:nucleoporin NUP159
MLKVSARPTIISITADGARLLISLVDGQIALYDTSSLFTEGSNEVHPVHSWSFPSQTGPQQILPNPGDMPHLVAVLLDAGAPQAVVILDVQNLENVGGWSREDIEDPITSCALFVFFYGLSH